MILNYTIFGERNSGTNYLRFVLDRILNVPHTSLYGFKHWYIRDHHPRCRQNVTTDNECLKSIRDSHHTLFVLIVRNPIDWIAAMYRRPYHIPESSRTSIVDFINQPHMSYVRNLPPNHTATSKAPWLIDPKTKNYFIEEANNILDLRNVKNDHFYALKDVVRYFKLVRLEHIQEDVKNISEEYNNKTMKWPEVFRDYIPPNSYQVDDMVRRHIFTNLDNYIDNTFYIEN